MRARPASNWPRRYVRHVGWGCLNRRRCTEGRASRTIEMIQLSPRDVLLIKVLEGGEDNILRFRVSNKDSLQDIDELERLGLLVRVDGKYILSLVAIEDLQSKQVTRANQIYYFCDHLLGVLQRLYEREPGSKF